MELRIQSLSQTYPNGIKALDNVTLVIPPGMYGLLRIDPMLLMIDRVPEDNLKSVTIE